MVAIGTDIVDLDLLSLRIARYFLLNINAAILLKFVDDPANRVIFHLILIFYLQRRHLMLDVIVNNSHPLMVIYKFIIFVRSLFCLAWRFSLFLKPLQRPYFEFTTIWVQSIFLFHQFCHILSLILVNQ